MKIKSVNMMRDIRDQISTDIQAMGWKEEQEYLRNQIKTFECLANPLPKRDRKGYLAPPSHTTRHAGPHRAVTKSIEP